MLRNDTCNRGFHNWRACPHPRHFYDGLPSNIRYPSPLVCACKAVYYTYQYARVWFAHIHICHQTLSTLLQQLTREIQPCHTSTLNRNYYDDTSRRICQYLCGRIGVCGSGACEILATSLAGIENLSCYLSCGLWGLSSFICGKGWRR